MGEGEGEVNILRGLHNNFLPVKPGNCDTIQVMETIRKNLILASASPRRQELLKLIGCPFTIEVSNAEELIPDGMAAHDIPQYLSGLKAEAVFSHHRGENAAVLGSDTVVALDGKVFGKPHDEADAFRMLRALSGREHEVITGVTILTDEKDIRFTSIARVRFYELSDEEIRAYIASGEPFGKAGSYAIQGKGALLAEGITGDVYTVIGLPVAEVWRRLREL